MRRGVNRLRRAAVRSTVMGVVVAMVLVMLPGIALAAFRPAATAKLSVGSAALATPSNLSVSHTCPILIIFGGTVRLSSFTEVPLADGYDIVLTRSGQVVDSQRVTSSRRVTFSFHRSGSYELTVTPTLKAWSAPPAVHTFTCN